MKNKKDTLTLKWGTLKSWNFENHEALKLLQEYFDVGSSASAICQRDTNRQKKIICELIDLAYGKIYLCWDGKYVSKAKAKKYVMSYGK